ncbi:MAG TPA: amidohydrolase family protein [Paucimonas sp.]|nr:amidohydrolase family protein [Paucimonas sp.]
MRFFPSLCAAALAAASTAAHAATIIDNANGYTFTKTGKLLRFSSLAIGDDGKVIAVGSAKVVAAKAPRAEHVDAGGKTLLPGLIDAHGHVFGLGSGETELSLRAARSLEEAQRAIADYAQAHPRNAWIRGGEWNQAVWKLGRFPTALEIDAVVADRPVWLYRVDGHAAWANTKAMQLAGVTKDTPDPEGGRIERDAAGNPTGVFIDRAMQLVARIVPPYSEAENRAALDAALARLAEAGLTSVHDAGVSAEQDTLFREYASRGKLTSRVYGMVRGVDAFFDRAAESGPLQSMANDMYALRAVKLFADGALGSRGAALLAPYSDAPQTRGLLFKDDEAMLDMMEKAMRKGYQVNAHAIGDAGNRQILDGFEKLARRGLGRGLRHRIEHAQVVALADIPRFARAGVLPSMQPIHATSDMNMAEDRVGDERIKGAYAWRTFLKQGSRIACGSDFPVESPNPFWGIHAAVTRQDAHDRPATGWYPEQAMMRAEALRCFTLDAAYAAHQEDVLGTLEPRKWADFIVIDRDLFTIPARDIHKIRVLQTWVAGRKVFER